MHPEQKSFVCMICGVHTLDTLVDGVLGSYSGDLYDELANCDLYHSSALGHGIDGEAIKVEAVPTTLVCARASELE